jgi:hypothetical protein
MENFFGTCIQSASLWLVCGEGPSRDLNILGSFTALPNPFHLRWLVDGSLAETPRCRIGPNLISNFE